MRLKRLNLSSLAGMDPPPFDDRSDFAHRAPAVFPLQAKNVAFFHGCVRESLRILIWRLSSYGETYS